MTPETWKKIEELYHAALQCEESGRAAFLDKAGADPPVREQVEILLRQSQEKSSFLERPALELEAESLAELVTGGHPLPPGSASLPSLGARYQLIKEVGRGGMGTV